MADPIRYRITVNRSFKLGDVWFIPPRQDGPREGFPFYEVAPEVYDGMLEDGSTAFKDVCATVEPEYPPA